VKPGPRGGDAASGAASDVSFDETAPIDGAIDGPAERHDTLGDPPPERASPAVPPGYRFADVIGRGGMGEVVLAEDLELGRDVAIKRMRSAAPSAEAIARFLREARIQARLDHPAIVPVHELGRDADGRPYFAMKRLTGVTLDRLIAEGAPAHKLLRAFVDVCLAIDLAHARGVIHRDLKPANVMLGDYGEVYVLDWGVARVMAEHDGPPIDGESHDGETQVGAVLGTPGYMSPEQLRGDPVTPATDVYALGAILYEILTGVAAHPRGQAAMVSTIAGPPAPPLARRPDRAIAPELDAACMAAMSDDPAARPSTRELADRIGRYLDGDRDVERRRALASEQLAAARAALATGAPAERSNALAAAGRALALDPESKDAAALVTQLMIEPPRELPPELAERLAEADRASIVQQTAVAARAMAAYFLFIPIALWAGIRSWGLFAAVYGIIAISIAGALLMSRRRVPGLMWALIANAAVLILLTRVFSPILIVPGLAGGIAVAMIALPALIHRPAVVVAAALAGFLVPLGLEAAGLWPRTWGFEGGRLVIAPGAVNLDGAPAALLIVGANVAIVAVMSLLVRSLASIQRANRRQLEIQAWHLGRLLPMERPPVPPPASAPAPPCGGS
jgi:eukaryotic-like serine/threonine-protein kinase